MLPCSSLIFFTAIRRKKNVIYQLLRKILEKNVIPGLAAIASRRGKSAEITNVNNDE
jgi:hypothetical protein